VQPNQVAIRYTIGVGSDATRSRAVSCNRESAPPGRQRHRGAPAAAVLPAQSFNRPRSISTVGARCMKRATRSGRATGAHRLLPVLGTGHRRSVRSHFGQ
jgi:hypothetical protein